MLGVRFPPSPPILVSFSYHGPETVSTWQKNSKSAGREMSRTSLITRGKLKGERQRPSGDEARSLISRSSRAPFSVRLLEGASSGIEVGAGYYEAARIASAELAGTENQPLGMPIRSAAEFVIGQACG